MEIQTLKSGNVELWSRRDGSADQQPILLIAGANASHLMWPDEFAEALASTGFSVLRYDHRDTGRSTTVDFDAYPYSVEDMATDAVAVLDAWKIKKAHVVGLSMGGTIAQLLALDHPNRVKSAVIMLTAGLDVDFVGNLSRVYSGEPEPQGLPLPRREILDKLAARSQPSSSQTEELDRRVGEWLALAGQKAIVDPEAFREWEAAAISHAGNFDQPSNHARATPVSIKRGVELKQISVPVMVIQGGQDPLNPPPHGKHITDQIPNAKLVHIEALGHALPRSLHQEIISAISSFCHAIAA